VSVRKQVLDICQSWNPTSASDVSHSTPTRFRVSSSLGLRRFKPETVTKLASSRLRELGKACVERNEVEVKLSTNSTRW
jgi:hypothetical protein